MTIEQMIKAYKRQLIEKEVAGVLTAKEVEQLIDQKHQDIQWAMKTSK